MGLEKESLEARIFMEENEDFDKDSDPAVSLEMPYDRDPHRINDSLKLTFVDVIGEPVTTRSFDSIWVCSHAVFEIAKFLLYKLLTLILAIPLSLVAGIVFAILSSLHIWIVVPFVKTILMSLPAVQRIWQSIVDSFVSPVFHSMGRCCSAVSIHVNKDETSKMEELSF
ncbi:caveolin-2 [Protopterus annectens]|uniref:caveolin-2 n=1 Tax=Protopterus annectens TaxID=7888 RepID=UPI001CFAB682|nr:caveolin-2 [Protopterus annectens]